VVDKCLCIFFNFFGVTSLSQLLLSYFESPPSGDKALIKLRRYYQEKKIEEGSKSFGDTTDTFIELLSSKIIEEIRNPNTEETDPLLKIQKHWPELFDTIQAKLHTPSSSLESSLQFIPSIVQDAQTDEEDDELLEPGTPTVEVSSLHHSSPAVFTKPTLQHRNSQDSLIEDELNNSLHILSRSYPLELNFDYDVIVSISPDKKITTVSCPPTTRFTTTRHRTSRPTSHPLPRTSRPLDGYDTDDIILDDREFLKEESFSRRDTGFITKVRFTDSMDGNMDDY